MKRKSFFLAILISLVFLGCAEKEDGVDYSKSENWAYFENEKTGVSADVFFVCPTVYGGSENSFNMALSDEKTKAAFLGATNMEKGIYDDDARFFAPYYKQVGLNVYLLEVEKREEYLKIAYDDVKNAFEFYMKSCNSGRPIILAGFSQGAQMCLRLMKDYFAKEKYSKKLVACYAIGWSFFEEEKAAYPKLRFAEGENDTGVIIAFNSESEDVGDSLMIPAEKKTLSINPLNWKTDSTPAEKELNIGACFTDYSGSILKEIPNLTGAYIDSKRGALKIIDVTSEEYPPVLPIFADGIFHLYDYQFFYRNLEKNVQDRIKAFTE